MLDLGTDVFIDAESLDSYSFARRKLTSFVASASSFRNCSFEDCEIQTPSFGAGKQESIYRDCVFDGLHARMGPGGRARFESRSFMRVRISHWFCQTAQFIDCSFSGNLNKIVFNGSVPRDKVSELRRSRNAFFGNDFSRAALKDFAFRTGIDLLRQQLPQSEDYILFTDARRQLDEASQMIAAWTDSSVKNLSSQLIRSLEDELAGNQEQLLIDTTTYLHGNLLAPEFVSLLIAISRRKPLATD